MPRRLRWSCLSLASLLVAYALGYPLFTWGHRFRSMRDTHPCMFTSWQRYLLRFDQDPGGAAKTFAGKKEVVVASVDPANGFVAFDLEHAGDRFLSGVYLPVLWCEARLCARAVIREQQLDELHAWWVERQETERKQAGTGDR